MRDGYNSRHNLTKNPAQPSADFDEGHFAFWFDATNKTVYLSPRFLGGQGQGITARNYSCMLPPSSVSGRKAIYLPEASNLPCSSLRSTAGKRRLWCATSRPAGCPARANPPFPGSCPLRAAYEYPLFKGRRKRSVFEAMVSHAKTYPAVDYWGEIETEILLRRFGNLFDIITCLRRTWLEQALVNEIRMTDQELNKYIQRELEGLDEASAPFLLPVGPVSRHLLPIPASARHRRKFFSLTSPRSSSPSALRSADFPIIRRSFRGFGAIYGRASGRA